MFPEPLFNDNPIQQVIVGIMVGPTWKQTKSSPLVKEKILGLGFTSPFGKGAKTLTCVMLWWKKYQILSQCGFYNITQIHTMLCGTNCEPNMVPTCAFKPLNRKSWALMLWRLFRIHKKSGELLFWLLSRVGLGCWLVALEEWGELK
jgi:hypothetical protein